MARRPAIVRDATNQISRYQQPDPNSGMETFARNTGASTSYAPGNAANADKNPVSLAMLRSAADQQDQGESARYAASNQKLVGEGRLTAADAMQNQRNDTMNQTAVKIMNPNMRLFLQSIKNAGGNKLASGAKTFHDAPGFFDVQDNRSLEKQSLQGLLRASDLNNYGKAY